MQTFSERDKKLFRNREKKDFSETENFFSETEKKDFQEERKLIFRNREKRFPETEKKLFREKTDFQKEKTSLWKLFKLDEQSVFPQIEPEVSLVFQYLYVSSVAHNDDNNNEIKDDGDEDSEDLKSVDGDNLGREGKGKPM